MNHALGDMDLDRELVLRDLLGFLLSGVVWLNINLGSMMVLLYCSLLSVSLLFSISQKSMGGLAHHTTCELCCTTSPFHTIVRLGLCFIEHVLGDFHLWQKKPVPLRQSAQQRAPKRGQMLARAPEKGES